MKKGLLSSKKKKTKNQKKKKNINNDEKTKKKLLKIENALFFIRPYTMEVNYFNRVASPERVFNPLRVIIEQLTLSVERHKMDEILI